MITDLQALYDYCEKIEHPLKCTIEITQYCNFRCPHCYIPNRAKAPALDLKKLCRIIDILAANGVCALTVTGGEPLTHPEFTHFYRYAKRRGFLIALLTNASLLTNEHVALFAEYPPFTIEISLYGSDAFSYKANTRKDAFEQVRNSMEKLSSQNIPVVVKTVIGTFNAEYLQDMLNFAASYGFDFRYDFEIHPRIDSNEIPLRLRLDPKKVTELQASSIEHLTIMKSIERAEHRYHNMGMHCSSGLTVFLIGSDGEISLCNWRRSATSFLDVSFKDAWQLVKDMRKELLEMVKESKCYLCQHRGYCNWCPAYALLEHGIGHSPIDWYCHLARERSLRLMNEV